MFETKKNIFPPDTLVLTQRLWNDWVCHYWKKIVIIMIFIAIIAVTTGLYPLAIDWGFETFAAKNKAAVYMVPIFAIVITSLKAGALYGQAVVTNIVMTSITRDFQSALYKHLIDSDQAQLDAKSSAALTARFTTDIGFIRLALERFVKSFIRDVLTIIILFVAMLYLDWQLALLVLFVFPIAILPMSKIGRRLRRITTSTQEEIGHMTALVYESLSGVRLAKTYGLESYLKERADQSFHRIRHLGNIAANQRARVQPTMELLGGLAVAGVAALIGWRIVNGHSSIGEFTGFLSALLLAAQPLNSLGNLSAILQEGLAACHRVFSLLDQAPTVTDRGGAFELKIKNATIRFERAEFHYAETKSGLNGIDLTLPGGSVTAFVGRSGAGKSTLFNLVPRLYDVTAGRVLIDEQDIREVSLRSLRDKIAMVSQDVVIFDDTICANIRFGRQDASDEEIIAAAKAAHAHHFITALPDGYDTIVGDRGARFSGGERQRIAIARAILRNAPILLLDEATSALDAESEQAVQDALKNLLKGRTTLIIAHRLSTVRDADQIIVLDKGQVAEIGPHENLISRKGLYAHLHRIQFRHEKDEI